MWRPEKLLYNLFLALYRLGARIAALWNPKAQKWVAAQRQVWQGIGQANLVGKTIWVHCASLGEYEQARPVIDALLATYPAYKIVVTFFSPSGYEVVSKRARDITVLYLPLDSAAHAQRFVKAVNPALAIFIKYEHWYHYLAALKQANIPALSVSAIFRPNQPFFKWYGALFRQMLRNYRQILVQDEASLQLLKSIGIENATLSGDTRYDRVVAISEAREPLPVIAQFTDDEKLIVAGSTWPRDEDLLVHYINQHVTHYPHVKYLLVPHEVSAAHIKQITQQLKVPYTLYTDPDLSARVMVVDTIGVLSKCYQYGNVAYVGGGFGVGIHNILEAAVAGVPVVFGPHYHKFNEAVALLACQGAFTINDYPQLEQQLNHLLDNDTLTLQYGNHARHHVYEQKGATDKVIEVVRGLLTP